MNILILGATGRIGSKLLASAIEDSSHKVSVLVRNPDKLLITSKNLTIIKGNALNKQSILEAMHDIDLVISALSTDGTNTLSMSMPLIIDVMKSHGIKRIITVGTSGILQSNIDSKLLRYQTNESRQKSTRAAEEHHKVYRLLKESDLEWTIICPTSLTNEHYSDQYRIQENFLPMGGVAISFQDVAKFIYSMTKCTKYLRTRIGIAY